MWKLFEKQSGDCEWLLSIAGVSKSSLASERLVLHKGPLTAVLLSSLLLLLLQRHTRMHAEMMLKCGRERRTESRERKLMPEANLRLCPLNGQSTRFAAFFDVDFAIVHLASTRAPCVCFFKGRVQSELGFSHRQSSLGSRYDIDTLVLVDSPAHRAARGAGEGNESTSDRVRDRRWTAISQTKTVMLLAKHQMR